MIRKPIPLDFVASRIKLDWNDVQFGFLNGWLGWKDVVELATQAVQSGESDADVVSLASVGKEDRSVIDDLLRALSTKTKPDGDSRKKWFFLALAWLYEHESQYPDSLAEVEAIASAFGFPPESYDMLKFMPSSGEYDPVQHPRSENLRRLRERWRKFVEQQSRIYGAGVGEAG